MRPSAYSPWGHAMQRAAERTAIIDRGVDCLRNACASALLLLGAMLAVPLALVGGVARLAVGVPLLLWRAYQYRRHGWPQCVEVVVALADCPACGAPRGVSCVGADVHHARQPGVVAYRAELDRRFGGDFGADWR